MRKRTKKSTGRKAVVTIMLVALLGVGGLAAYVQLTPAAHHVPDELRADPIESTDRTQSSRSSNDSKPAGPDVSVATETGPKLRIPLISGDSVTLGSAADPIPAGVKPIVYLSNLTLQALKIEKARALGVDIHGRNALVDFSEDLEQGFGSFEEGTVVKAFQTALGQIPEIDTFQFVVNGKTLDTLGQLDLKDPIAVTRIANSSEKKAPIGVGSDEDKPTDTKPTDPASNP